MPRLALIPAVMVTVALLACDRPSAPAPRGAPNHVYTVRGQVVQVPEPGNRLTEFSVHHEAIDDFVNPNGTFGMDSMVMGFPLAKGLDLSEVRPGDIVEIQFAHWTTPGQLGYEATRVTRLAPDTVLRFEKAVPRAPAPK